MTETNGTGDDTLARQIAECERDIERTRLKASEVWYLTHTFLTAWDSRQAFSDYMRGEAHRVSHSREPAEIMARTTVRHEAFEVLMDSRRVQEWTGLQTQ